MVLGLTERGAKHYKNNAKLENNKKFQDNIEMVV
jgi:hypothetical protein